MLKTHPCRCAENPALPMFSARPSPASMRASSQIACPLKWACVARCAENPPLPMFSARPFLRTCLLYHARESTANHVVRGMVRWWPGADANQQHGPPYTFLEPDPEGCWSPAPSQPHFVRVQMQCAVCFPRALGALGLPNLFFGYSKLVFSSAKFACDSSGPTALWVMTAALAWRKCW